MRRGVAAVTVFVLVVAACQRTTSDSAVAGDTAAAADTPEPGLVGTGDSRADTQEEWPDAGPVDYRRERSVDLTGDESSEMVVVTARGPAWDSLDIALTIVGGQRDTLWHESWPSLLYFKYDTLAGKADSTVRRIVRDHVEQLLASDRFTMQGGLPAVLRRSGDPDAIMREAIHYHLAELDWRRGAGLSPAAATPPDAYSEISTDSVEQERVDAVLAELRGSPSFMYYAGGEATYAIAWSEREAAFVRVYSCC
jgi:hypothetical protein